MNRFTSIVLPTVLLLFSAVSIFGQDKKPSVEEPNPYFDETVFAFVHVDIKKSDINKLESLMKRFDLDLLPAYKKIASSKPIINTLRRTLLEMKVTELLVLISTEQFQEIPVILLPVTDANRDKVKSMLDVFSNDQVAVYTLDKRFLMLGGLGAADRIRSKQFRPRTDSAVLQRLPGGSALSVHIAISDSQRRVVRELFPKLPTPLDGFDGEMLAEDVKTVSMKIHSLEPLSLTFEIVTANSDAARKVQSALDTAISDTESETELTELQPALAQFADERPLTRAGNVLKLELNEANGGVDDLLTVFKPALKRTRNRFALAMDEGKLSQIGIALHNFYDTHKRLPALANFDKSGKPLLSWRVHILPFVGHESLYKKFRLEEPWDSEHNRKLIDRMPDVYRSENDKDDIVGKTRFQVPHGEGMFFHGRKGREFKEINDGTSNTIMTAQVLEDRAVTWTKPADWNVEPDNPKAALIDATQTRAIIGRGDGSTSTFSNETTNKLLRALLTIDAEDFVSELK